MKIYNSTNKFIITSDKQIKEGDYVLRPNLSTINVVRTGSSWSGSCYITLGYARKFCKRVSYIFKCKKDEKT
jgi:hypothetical protein